jgi:hypothetical protein
MHYHYYKIYCKYLYWMTSEIGDDVPNPFLNLMGLWQNYLVYWIEVSRNFYENAIKNQRIMAQSNLGPVA